MINVQSPPPPPQVRIFFKGSLILNGFGFIGFWAGCAALSCFLKPSGDIIYRQCLFLIKDKKINILGSCRYQTMKQSSKKKPPSLA